MKKRMTGRKKTLTDGGLSDRLASRSIKTAGEIEMTETTTTVDEQEVTDEQEESTARKTGNQVKIGDIIELPEYTDTLDFTIPKDNLKDEYKEQAGKKLKDQPFTFAQVETDEQAADVCGIKEWDLKSFVNDALKATARSAAYQRLTLQYKESKMSEEDSRQRLINAFQRMGLSLEAATQSVDDTLRKNRGAQ